MDALRQTSCALVLSMIRLSVWLILLAAIFVPIEVLFRLRSGRVFRSGILTDVGYLFVNGIVPGFFLSIPLTATAMAAHHLMPTGVTGAFAHAPLGLRILVTLVVAEVGLYWGHRWSHELPLLWRFHAVHHSPTQVDWLVNVRGHPVDFIFTRLCGLMPLYILGLGTPLEGEASLVPLLAMVLGPAWGFFIHANISWRFGPLEWLITTPAFHHWHHTNDNPTVINKNYAPMFPWIDRIFGSLYLPSDSQPMIYGTDSPVPAGMAGQLIEPFLRRSRYQRLLANQPPEIPCEVARRIKME